jgi:dimethylhistidine N-methyltransferase
LSHSDRCTTERPIALRRPHTIVQLIDPRESAGHLTQFASAVRAGLMATPKTLPWRYFYDEEGSRLFEAICELPEYYLTRTEDAILCRHADALVDCLGDGGSFRDEPTIIELGSGSAIKTQRLITAALRRHDRLHYVPIDVSPSAVEECARRLTARFPNLRVTGYVADYRRGLERIMARAQGVRLIVFLGSSLGNYDLGPATELLTMIRRTMRPGDRLVLGTDMAKDAGVLEEAYDDAQGVTAAFNLNLLARINRELGGDFPLDGFTHRAIYRPAEGRVEMHLVSLRDQTVSIRAADLSIRFAAGETIHTENSHKFTTIMLDQLCQSSGYLHDGAWSDRRGWFRLQRWRPDGD